LKRTSTTAVKGAKAVRSSSASKKGRIVQADRQRLRFGREDSGERQGAQRCGGQEKPAGSKGQQFQRVAVSSHGTGVKVEARAASWQYLKWRIEKRAGSGTGSALLFNGRRDDGMPEKAADYSKFPRR